MQNSGSVQSSAFFGMSIADYNITALKDTITIYHHCVNVLFHNNLETLKAAGASLEGKLHLHPVHERFEITDEAGKVDSAYKVITKTKIRNMFDSGEDILRRGGHERFFLEQISDWVRCL